MTTTTTVQPTQLEAVAMALVGKFAPSVPVEVASPKAHEVAPDGPIVKVRQRGEARVTPIEGGPHGSPGYALAGKVQVVVYDASIPLVNQELQSRGPGWNAAHPLRDLGDAGDLHRVRVNAHKGAELPNGSTAYSVTLEIEAYPPIPHAVPRADLVERFGKTVADTIELNRGADPSGPMGARNIVLAKLESVTAPTSVDVDETGIFTRPVTLTLTVWPGTRQTTMDAVTQRLRSTVASWQGRSYPGVGRVVATEVVSVKSAEIGGDRVRALTAQVKLTVKGRVIE